MEIVGEGQEMADLPEFNLLHLYICGSFWGITDDIMGLHVKLQVSLYAQCSTAGL